jgi:hydroxypyruvate isomerase
MPRFAANLSMLYTEHEFIDRFKAAAQDGFKAVEFLFPYAFDAQLLKQQLADNGLEQVLFNAPPGNWEAGERGIACIPGREAEFQAGFISALRYAEVLDCPRIHVMAGIKPRDAAPEALRATYLGNIQWAAQEAQKSGRDVLLEPINTRDMPGYFLNYQEEAHQFINQIQAEMGITNLKVQMDLYHCQIMEGDLASKLRQYLPTGRVGHIQIAGVPMRHEPDRGEVNYPYLFDVIDEVSAACGWQGWIGCEYKPAQGSALNATRNGLGWMITPILIKMIKYSH